jgi:hypothetical protein
MPASLKNYFLSLNYSPIHLIEQMKIESSIAVNYYPSPVGVFRCDVSGELRNELAKIIKVPFFDCGFLKTKPGQIYKPHVDVFRIAAINMTLYEDPGNARSYVVGPTGVVNIGYIQHCLTLLNVMNIHGVDNKNETDERIILSIGIKDYSYSQLEEMHNCGELLNEL